MDRIKIRTFRLQHIVEENSKRHKQEYTDAYQGYREQYMVKLYERINFYEEELQKAKEGREINHTIAAQLGLERPQQFLKDYERVMKMLQLTEDEFVELTHEEFAQFVQDDWRWKQQFSTSTANYLSKK